MGDEPPAFIDCEVDHSATHAAQCAYVRTPGNNCATQAIFPYVEAYFCWGVVGDDTGLRGRSVAIILVYVVWALLLFVVLATTADDYFAPSLTTLSRWLGLRERIAGLTFLALGNGAADMFSVIAAVQVGATDLAVGALQGGSMCVTCVCTIGVLGAVRGGEVKASGVFFTDLFVNVVSCVAVFAILWTERVTIWESVALLGLYALYVAGVSLVGHGYIPPMRAVDRVAWRAKKESEKALLESLTSSEQGLPGAAPAIGVVGPMYRPTEQDQRLAQLGWRARDAAWVRFRTLREKPDAPPGGATLEERRSFGYRMRWHATSSMGSAWEEKDWPGKAMFAFESWVHLLRAITTPVTPPDDELSGDKWNRGFERARAAVNLPFFAAFTCFWVVRRVHGNSYDEDGEQPLRLGYVQDMELVGPMPLPFFAFLICMPLGIAVWILCKDGMPAWLRNVYVIPSFCAAVIWFDIYACELVECLRTFGFVLDIPTSLLGVTILAWGNSIGDFFADRSVARDGYVKMAISGCFGEPNFPRLIGLGLAFLFVTISASPDAYTQGVGISLFNIIGFGAQWVVLLTVGTVAALDDFRLRAKVLIPVLAVEYVAFLCGAGLPPLPAPPPAF